MYGKTRHNKQTINKYYELQLRMTYVLATLFILQKEKVSIHKAKHSYACIHTSTPYPRNIQINSNTYENRYHIHSVLRHITGHV